LDIRLLSREDRIDYVCDLFEGQWLSGQQPAIRDFLPNCESDEQPDLFIELLLVEIEYLRDSGESLSIRDYRKKFPEFTAEIEAVNFQHGISSTVSNSATETVASSLKQGAQLAHFKLLKKIGSGAVGEVWKARDMRLKRIVAVKVPRHNNLSENELRRFQREGQAAAQLQHPNIVSIHEVGREVKVVFIVSEYIDGMDLRESLRGNQLTHHTAIELCAKLADALHHAHEQGVIHRDLKPANVLLDHKGVPYITDFGLAKWLLDEHPLTIEGQLLGTPAYMSPEQARGEVDKVDRRSDVYALGVLLYEILTGNCPFRGDQAAVVHAVIHQEPSAPRNVRHSIPRDLETICLKAIEKDPNRRYPSAQELAVDLRRFLRSEPIYAHRVGLFKASWRWIRNRPAISFAALFALIALGSIASAMILADENRALIGLKTVKLTTEPAGAKIAFVPLGEMTKEPLSNQLVHVQGRSPVEQELKSGDYLVTAVLPDGSFHEVYRHVPKTIDALPGHYNHLRWRIDGASSVVLPTIRIPETSIIDNMVLVSRQQDSRKATKSGYPFYVDCNEFTVGEYKALFRGRTPMDLRYQLKPDDFALTVSYDQATYAAELAGKRLPTEAEFQILFSQLLKQIAIEDLHDLRKKMPHEIGAISQDSTYPLKTFLPVNGLVTNVAEWTSTSIAIEHADLQSPGFLDSFLNPPRVVLGGTYELIGGSSEGESSVQERFSARCVVDPHTIKPGLGFRCIRSQQPRFIDLHK